MKKIFIFKNITSTFIFLCLTDILSIILVIFLSQILFNTIVYREPLLYYISVIFTSLIIIAILGIIQAKQIKDIKHLKKYIIFSASFIYFIISIFLIYLIIRSGSWFIFTIGFAFFSLFCLTIYISTKFFWTKFFI